MATPQAPDALIMKIKQYNNVRIPELVLDKINSLAHNRVFYLFNSNY
ncbi:hypothetical protein RINTHH_10860 [Richelia intracellularis HH01]|uniref:Uncharacterized protein n=1 Tax=Richelia intracellularis HH01 TaxID=1165094 RepID=M1X5D5_9NOST|nr:hypothetical protein RINTHH_10860 [Richelia intracellularis HH01]